MSFSKRANTINTELKPLNVPYWPEYKMVKLAAISKKDDSGTLGGFDIQSAIKDNPDSLFVKVFAIKKDEVNDNGDAFSEAELKKAASTFVGVPIFCNHQNDDVEKARGKCVHAWYDDELGGINIIAMVDRVAYPKLARGIEEGYINGTSMGCSVEASICSICRNVARTADEYCDHVRNQKNRKFNGRVKDAYGKNGITLEDYGYNECPIKLDVDEDGYIHHKNAHVYEHNFGINFIEDSFVVNPACHDCLVQEIFNVSELSRKVASLKNVVQKISSQENCDGSCSIVGDKMQKVAGQAEIKTLLNAMDDIEKVAKSMMAQKEHVSMEYVSDLVEALANVQSISDELIEMGYAQLPSPPDFMTGEDIVEKRVAEPQQPQVTAPAGTVAGPQSGLDISPGQKKDEVSVENIGDLGSVTMPKSSSNENNTEKKKEFVKLMSKLNHRLSTLANNLNEYMGESEISENKESIMATKNSNSKVNNEKVAEHDTSVITQKQLNDAEFTGERWDGAPDTITEKQLDDPNANKDANTTTTDSPQERSGSYEVVTEKQFSNITSGYVTRWGDFPEVITEKQWNETSRLIGSVLNEDQDNIITEKQLNDFVSHHTYPTPNVTTQKQLGDQDGDISRWAASNNDAKKVVTAAVEAISDTIAFYGKTPSDIKKAASYINQNARRLDKASYLTLLNASPFKAEDRNSEKQKYTYFNKMAKNIQTPNTIDALLVSTADHLDNLSADDVLTAIKVVASNAKGMKQSEQKAKVKMASGPQDDQFIDKTAQFESALYELDRPEDGIYQVHATVKEIGDPTDKKAFLQSVIKLAKSEIDDPDVKVALTKVDIDEDQGVVVATFKNEKDMDEKELSKVAQFRDILKDEQLPWEPEEDEEDWEAMDPEDEDIFADDEIEDFEASLDLDEIEALASSSDRDKIAKTAQMFGGQGGPGLGGEIPGGADGGAGLGAGGGGTTMPTPPGAEQAPLESFEETDMGQDLEADTEQDLQPKPPGAMCPVCGSNDVDVLDGRSRCNNCTSEFVAEVMLKVTKYKGFLDDNKEDEEAPEAEMMGEEEFEGEGFEMPVEEGEAEAEAGAMPAAAASKNDNKVQKVASKTSTDKFALVTKLKSEAMKKANEAGIELGTISPITGTSNTMKLAGPTHVCLDTGISYDVEYAVDNKNKKNVYAKWSWSPMTAFAECKECSRSRRSFLKALESMNIAENKFDAMSAEEKGKTILAMKDKGLLKTVKTAGKKSSVVEELKTKMAGYANEFPEDMCRQKLANRFGLNAIALSGPCEGKSLVDCVCKSLKNAGVYSNNLAIKVAEIWADRDAYSECLEDYIKTGFDYKKACTVCEAIKAKYAGLEDALVEELEVIVPDEGPDGTPMDDDLVEVDPFDEDGGTISVELPLKTLEEIDEAIDKSLGEDPSEEPHHNVEVPEGEEAEVTIPEDAAEAIDDAADEVLDEELGVEENVEEEVEEGMDEDVEDVQEEMEDQAVEETEDMYMKDKKDEMYMGGKTTPATPAPDTAKTLMTDPVGEEDADINNDGEVDEQDEYLVNRREDIAEDKGDEELEDRLQEVEEKIEKIEGDSGTDENVNDNEGVMNPEETDEPVEKEGDDEEKAMQDTEMDTMAETIEQIEKEANTMKPGYIGKTGRIGLDLSGVMEVLTKQAQSSKSLEQQNAQDVKEIGTYSTGKTITKEENPLTEGGPEVPDVSEQKASVGKENPPKSDKVKVPAGSGPIGGEKDNEELSGGNTTMTGGEEGAGSDGAGHKNASSRDKINSLADRILEASEKQKLTEKKMAPKEPVSEDKDIQPIGDDSTIGDEEKFDADKVEDNEVKSDSGFIGKEKETFDNKPDTPEDQPSIPAGKGKMENEDNDPEKQEKDKGTVIAESKNAEKRQAEATRIAGRMLEAGRIDSSQLASKISELSEYKLAQLEDIEKGIFAQKGLNTVAEGIESPLVIGEESNQRTASTELKSQLTKLFSLERQNNMAQDLDTDLRQAFNKR